jgi:hypothetical protein
VATLDTSVVLGLVVSVIGLLVSGERTDAIVATTVFVVVVALVAVGLSAILLRRGRLAWLLILVLQLATLVQALPLSAADIVFCILNTASVLALIAPSTVRAVWLGRHSYPGSVDYRRAD